MEQSVYIDLYFLINLSMDLLCFFLTSRLLSYPFKAPRVLAAAVSGGVYACFALLVSVGGVWGVLLDLGACFLMSVIAVYRRGQMRQSATYALVYAAVSILLGGTMTALFSLFNKLGLDALMGSSEDADGMSVWLFVVLAIISGVAAAFGGSLFRRKSARQRGELKISYSGRSVRLEAMCDSGNMLREPISNKLCVVVDSEAVAKMFPLGSLERTVGAERIRVIPTKTVNGEGMLYAVRVDAIKLNMGKGWCELDAYVALGEVKNGVEGARALVPSELVFGAP